MTWRVEAAARFPVVHSVVAVVLPKRALFAHVIPMRLIVAHVPAAAGAATRRPSNNPDVSDEGSRLAKE